MEGFAVLRACALAAFPGARGAGRLERVGEPDRAHWRFDEGFAMLAEIVPVLLEVLRCLSFRRRCRRETRTVGQLIAETIRAYGDNFWRALPLGLPLALATRSRIGQLLERSDASCCWRCTPLIAAAFVRACSARARHAADPARLPPRVLIWLPVPFLFSADRPAGASRGWRSSGSRFRPRCVERPLLPRGARARAPARRRPTTCTRSARSPRP